MADTLVTRTTGQAHADQVPVEVQLVISDTALLGLGTIPAEIVGYGPIPAQAARSLVTRLDPKTPVWLRRLYSTPHGRLVAMESQARLFSPGMRRYIAIRDQYCRTPWCGAPIRHADHVRPVHHGGSTCIANAQGLCERCNQNKETPGWRARPGPSGDVTLTTPTGHTYDSTAPPLLTFDRPILVDLRFTAAA